MASEIQVKLAQAGLTLGAVIRDRIARVWSTSGGTGAFESYQTAHYSDYVISMTEQGTASAFYAGTMPPAIPAGVYGVTVMRQIGGSPAESDPCVGEGDLQWNGSQTLPLSDLASSGQVGLIAPLKMARGVMVQNFRFKLVSDADNKTPFVSGVVSGQIGRDAGAFGALQSGVFTELGLGHYCVTLTSGDLNANTASLVITANGISGGRAAQRDFSFVLQRSSGQV